MLQIKTDFQRALNGQVTREVFMHTALIRLPFPPMYHVCCGLYSSVLRLCFPSEFAVAISLSGPSEGEEPYGAVVESDLDQFSPTKTPVAPGSSVSRHVSMVRDRSPLSRTSIESLHDEMPSNDGEQHASCSAGGVASFVEKDIGSAVEDDEEDKKLSAMRERLLNSMAKKSVGLQVCIPVHITVITFFVVY